MTDEILKRIDLLAAKLGVTAQYLWGVLVKQARVEMWQDAAIAAFWTLIAVALAVMGTMLFRDDDSDSHGAGFSAWCIGFLALLVALYYGCAAMTEGCNPEYWALKQIMEAAGK